MARAHGHQEIELNLLESGSMTYLCGGQIFTLLPQRLLLFWAAFPHQVIAISPETRGYWITIPFATFMGWPLPAELQQRVLTGERLLARQLARPTLDLELCAQWEHDLRTAPAMYRTIVLQEIEVRLQRFAAEAFDDNGAPLERPEQRGAFEYVRTMAAYLVEHAAEPLRVEVVAAQVGLHPHYAMTLFRQIVAMTMGEYLTRYRIAQAQRLLVTTDHPISLVALEVGVQSLSQFYAIFRRITGTSPQAYRRQHASSLGPAP